MAFKRSAVRSRISPPEIRQKLRFLPYFFNFSGRVIDSRSKFTRVVLEFALGAIAIFRNALDFPGVPENFFARTRILTLVRPVSPQKN